MSERKGERQKDSGRNAARRESPAQSGGIIRCIRLIIIIFAAVFASSFVGTAGIRLYRFKQAAPPRELTEDERKLLDDALDKAYPAQNEFIF